MGPGSRNDRSVDGAEGWKQGQLDVHESRIVAMSRKLPFHKSFWIAVRGVCEATITERNLRIQLIIAIFVTSLGASMGLTSVEWACVILSMGLVLAAEIMNTAIEALVNLLEPQVREEARQAKDFAAGSVLVTSLTAALVGAVVLGKALIRLLYESS